MRSPARAWAGLWAAPTRRDERRAKSGPWWRISTGTGFFAATSTTGRSRIGARRIGAGIPWVLEFGWRDGPRLVLSLDPGHEVDLLLSRIALPHALPLDFDDLPIPFRAVATDLEAAEVAELGNGSLASALRATMSIPGVFDPVERDSLLLGDGGLLNNVPADIVSRMDVDVVIAVDVGVPLQTREEMRSLVSLAGQSIQIMMTERARSVMSRHADHIITPPLEGISLLDWRRFDAIRAMGYRAAAEAGDSLAYLSLSPAEWARHVEARRARRPLPLAELQFVEVAGVDRRSAEEIARALEPALGTAPDPDELEFRLTRLAGGGRYRSLGYDAAREGDRTGIVVRARDKSHGPPFLNLALEVEDRTAAGWEVSLGTRFTVFDAGSRDAELRLDLSVGPDRTPGWTTICPFCGIAHLRRAAGRLRQSPAVVCRAGGRGTPALPDPARGWRGRRWRGPRPRR